METINVQFADSTEAVVVAYFSGPQDPDVYPNQGKIGADDARWKTFLGSLPEAMQVGLPAASSN